MTSIYPQIRILNPTMQDFTTTYDIHGDGNPVSYTLFALEDREFDAPVAEHIIKHLGYKIANETKGKGTFEDAFKKAEAEIRMMN